MGYFDIEQPKNTPISPESKDGKKEIERFDLIEKKLLGLPGLKEDKELERLSAEFRGIKDQFAKAGEKWASTYVPKLQTSLSQLEKKIDDVILRIVKGTIQIVPQTPAVQTILQPVQQTPVIQEPKNPPLLERIRMKEKGVVPAALSGNSTKADTSKQSVPENSTTVVRKLEIFKAYIETQPINETKKSIILSHITNLSTFLSGAPYLVDHKEFKDSFSKIEDVIKTYIENGKRVSSFDAFDDSLLKEYEKNIQKVIGEAKQGLSTINNEVSNINSWWLMYGNIGNKLNEIDKMQSINQVRDFGKGLKLGSYKIESSEGVLKLTNNLLGEMGLTNEDISNLSESDKEFLIHTLQNAIRIQKDLFDYLQKELDSDNPLIKIGGKEIRFRDKEQKVRDITKFLRFLEQISKTPKDWFSTVKYIISRLPVANLFSDEEFLVTEFSWLILFAGLYEFAPSVLGKVTGIPGIEKLKYITKFLEIKKIQKLKEEAKTNSELSDTVKKRKEEIETLIESERIKTGGKGLFKRDSGIIKRLQKLIDSGKIYLPEEDYRRYFYEAYEATRYGRLSTTNGILTRIFGERGGKEERKIFIDRNQYIVDEITKIKKSIYGFPGFEYGTRAEKSAILEIDAATKKFFQEGKDKAIDTNGLDGEQIKEKIAKELRNFVMQKVDFLLPEGELKDYLSKELLDKSNPEDVKKIEEDAKKAEQIINNRVYDPSVSETEKALDKAARKRYIATLADDLIQGNHSSTRIEYRMRLLIVLGSNPNNYKRQFPFESLSQKQLLDTLETENLEFEKNVVKKFKDDTKINALKERQDKLKDRISVLKPYYNELDGIDMSKVEEKNLKALEETVEKLEGLRGSYDGLVSFKSDIDSLIKDIISDIKGKLSSGGTLTLDARLGELISEIPQIRQITTSVANLSSEAKSNIEKLIKSGLGKVDDAGIITRLNDHSSTYKKVVGDTEVRNLLEKAFSGSDIDFDTIAKIEQYYKEYDGKQLQPAERNKDGVIIKEEVSVEEQRAKLRDELLGKTETPVSTETQTPKESSLSPEEARKIDIATGFIEEVYQMYSNSKVYTNLLDVSMKEGMLEALIATTNQAGEKGITTIKVDTLSDINPLVLLSNLQRVSQGKMNSVDGMLFTFLKDSGAIIEFKKSDYPEFIKEQMQARKGGTPEVKQLNIEEMRKSAERRVLGLREFIGKPKI